jgi:DNA-binding MarR family transcriptional regulator
MLTGHSLAMALRVAYLTMHRQANASLQPGGVTADQFVLLAALAETDSSTQQELAFRTSCDPNTLRAMLVLLERRGLIRRAAHPTDRRARRVALTPQGRRQFEELHALSEPFRCRLLDALGPENAETLARLLNLVAEAMSPVEAGDRKVPRTGRRQAITEMEIQK